MQKGDFMSEQEVFELLDRKKTALWRLRQKYDFPHPVLTYPSRYSRKAVYQWFENGGMNKKKTSLNE
ncbi:DNA-binding protein [Salmonella enterica]|nr:DNA-binding protein [Salmonella enterica]